MDFTTPSLDFADHSSQLESMIVNLDEIKLKLSIAELQSHCYDLLTHFNYLTKPPVRRGDITKPAPTKQASIYSICNQNLDPTLSAIQKAYYFYLRGRILNILPYHVKVEFNLVSAVKLNPIVKSWKELGECYAANGNWDLAKECFYMIVSLGRTPTALVDLALLRRRDGFIDDSISLCNEALGIEPDNAAAWSGLGLSYFSKFFRTSHKRHDQEMAVRAFDKAVAMDSNCPDMYQARGLLHYYLDHHKLAIESLQMASIIAPSINNADHIRSLLLFKHNFKELVANNYGMTVDRIQNSISGFKSSQSNDLIVINYAPANNSVARSYCCLDVDGKAVGLSILNVARSKIQKGDYIEVTDGRREDNMVWCDQPCSLIVNGTRLGKNDCEWVLMSYLT